MLDAGEVVSPSSKDHMARQRESQTDEAAATRERPPPIPYRADITGLSTLNLPRPPVRSAGATSSLGVSSTSPSPKPKPSLPPRLPPRRILPSSQGDDPEPPPPYSRHPSQADRADGSVNQGALSRLDSAGIRVPGLGIGGESASSHSWQGRQQGDSESPNATPVKAPGSQLQSLSSRFSNLSIPSSSSSSTDVPAHGTSFAQKQAAVKTASAFRNDPASVSLSEVKATAATANNFRERHGEQVTAGWQAGNALNKRYDVVNQVSNNARVGTDVANGPERSSLGAQSRSPPPVPKKSFVTNQSAPTVPPVPWSSKPKP